MGIPKKSSLSIRLALFLSKEFPKPLDEAILLPDVLAKILHYKLCFIEISLHDQCFEAMSFNRFVCLIYSLLKLLNVCVPNSVAFLRLSWKFVRLTTCFNDWFRASLFASTKSFDCFSSYIKLVFLRVYEGLHLLFFILLDDFPLSFLSELVFKFFQALVFEIQIFLQCIILGNKFLLCNVQSCTLLFFEWKTCIQAFDLFKFAILRQDIRVHRFLHLTNLTPSLLCLLHASTVLNLIVIRE